MNLYRATTDTETGIQQWTCWATDHDTAVAYTEDGVGHGGKHIREIEIDPDYVLDITGSDPFRQLAEALEYDDPAETGQQWMDNGWRYPWEESSEIAKRLAASYDWVRYEDDYPDGAITMLYCGASK